MMKRFHPERGLSLRKSPSSVLLSFYLYLLFFCGGNLHSSFSLILCSVNRSLSVTWWLRSKQADPCLNSHHAPPSPKPRDPAILPQICFVKHSGIANVLRSTMAGRAKKHRTEKRAKHFGEFRRRQLHYAGDACCVKCQLASITLLAPAQHVCPHGTSLDCCRDNFLSVWLADPLDKCEDGTHDVKRGWTPVSNPYYSMIKGVGKTSVIWNMDWKSPTCCTVSMIYG